MFYKFNNVTFYNEKIKWLTDNNIKYIPGWIYAPIVLLFFINFYSDDYFDKLAGSAIIINKNDALKYKLIWNDF